MESVTLKSGTPVRVVFHDGRVLFVILEFDVVLDGLRPREMFYCYRFDPLTTRGGEGLCVIRPEGVLTVEPIPRTPVAFEYTIDSDVTFSHDARSRYGLAEVPEAFARAFLQSLLGGLASHDPPLLRRDPQGRHFNRTWASDRGVVHVRNTDLTDLGLDFMRQHYHHLKEDALAHQRIPDEADLRRLIARTESHRTTDDDWRLAEI